MNRTVTAFLLTICGFLSANAQTNFALNGGAYGPESIIGYNAGSLSTIGNVQVGNTIINDGATAMGDYSHHVHEFGQPNGANGQVGIIFSTPVTKYISSVTFYDAAFFDGGWFGVAGKGQNGVDDSDPGVLSSAALVVPMLQLTYSANPTSASAVWTTVADTNNYLSAMTGIPMPTPFNTPTSAPSTFKLDTAVVGITGIRLIGESGGYSSNGGGFIGAYEFEVTEVPEPSAYALMLGGLVVLGFCLRRKRASVK